MSYRVLTMLDVKEILRRLRDRQAVRRIAKETGHDRKTVRRYVDAAKSLGVDSDEDLTDERVGEVAARVQTRPAPARSADWTELREHKEKISEWLEGERPLRLRKVHKLLGRRGVSASYWILRRFVIEELGWGERDVTVLLEESEPGQEAQVDFGQMGRLWDDQQGRMRVLYALIITLAFSRYQFVWPTFRQNTEAVCEGLEAAWAFFGGMPATLIPDNTKAMIVQADALAPRLTEAFADYVQARGLYVDPARVRRPKDKAKVENQVRYVRGDCFSGEELRGLQHAREHARHWCGEQAGRRTHGTTLKQPRQVYEDVEKGAMLAPAAETFDVPAWGKATVRRDCHVYVKRALYSVSYLLHGKEVSTRADTSTVKIIHNNRVIKVHPRQAPGGRSTDTSDYPPGKAMYARRSVTEHLECAQQQGQHVGQYAERLLDGPLPWTRLRQVNALVVLCKRFGAGRVEALCQSALAFDVVDVTRVRRMLEKASEPPMPEEGPQKVVSLTAGRFVRDGEQFATRKVPDGKEVP